MPGHITRQNYNSKNTCTPIFTAVLFTIIKIWKQSKVSTDRWMDKECVVHICNGILLNHKKEWNNVSCSNTDATRDYHTKWIHSEKDWQTPYDFIYVWNLSMKQTHRHKE